MNAYKVTYLNSRGRFKQTSGIICENKEGAKFLACKSYPDCRYDAISEVIEIERTCKVVKVYKNSKKRLTVFKNVSLQEAQRIVRNTPETNKSFVVFYYEKVK